MKTDASHDICSSLGFLLKSQMNESNRLMVMYDVFFSKIYLDINLDSKLPFE